MIDASAIVAILLGEEDAEGVAGMIVRQSERFTTSVSLMETSIRLLRLRHETEKQVVGDIDYLLSRLRVEVRDVDGDAWRVAARAYARFGKGRHPAGLNFGDCLAYAAAKQAGVRLVYKGEDFALTDVNDGLQLPY
jgi:ribonuclease VapC